MLGKILRRQSTLNITTSALNKTTTPGVDNESFSTFHPPQHKLFMEVKPMRRMHPIYSMKGIEDIEETHRKPENIKERIAKLAIRILRGTYDKLTNYNEV